MEDSTLPKGYMLVKESEYKDTEDLLRRIEQAVYQLKDSNNRLSSDVLRQVQESLSAPSGRGNNRKMTNQNELVQEFERKCKESTLRSQLETQKSNFKKALMKTSRDLQTKQKDSQNDLKRHFEEGRTSIKAAYEKELLRSFQNKSALNNSVPVEQYACAELINSYRKSMEDQLLPAMRDMYGNHCQKLDQALKKWVHEYTQRLHDSSQLSPAVQNKVDQIQNRIARISEEGGGLATIHQQRLDPAVQRVTSKLRNFEVQASVTTSEDLINVAIEQKRFHTAMEMALNAKDLDLVLETCRQVPVEDMFRDPPSQLILLSIFAHLQADLHVDLELKSSYLIEAIQAVDMTDQTVRHHKGQLMQTLIENIDTSQPLVPRDMYNLYLKNLRWSASMLMNA